MSLIIKGIDLPKEGSLVIAIQKYGNIYIQQKSKDGRNIFVDQKDYQQAIQIPKGHGRIGDLDKLQVNVTKATTYGDALHEIKKAPTILEAEQSEVRIKEVVKDYITATYGDISNL